MTSRWLVTGALAACTSPHQLVLSIDTTAGVPCDIDRIRIVAMAAGTTTIDQPLKGARLPISVTLLDDTPDGRFQLEISGLKGEVEVLRVTGPLQFTGHTSSEAVRLDPRCTRDARCELSDVMTAAAMPPASAVECGANVTRYSASPSIESGESACTVPGAKRVVMAGGSGSARLMDLESQLLDSGFQFYGRPVRQVWVTKDGYLSFAGDPQLDGVLQPGPLDRDIKHVGAPPPRLSVMAFWDTLWPRPSGVCYELDGPPRKQQLRVTWEGACLTQPCGSDNLNFTFALDETSGGVLLTYGAMEAGNKDRASGLTATVGLVNDATGCPSEDCTLATGLCKDGRTPCGYSQVFSNTVQSPLKNRQFTPVVDP